MLHCNGSADCVREKGGGGGEGERFFIRAGILSTVLQYTYAYTHTHLAGAARDSAARTGPGEWCRGTSCGKHSQKSYSDFMW